MQQITDLFTDFFDKQKITNERLGQFTIDHVERITANNQGGVFSTIITNTNAALDELVHALGQKGSAIGDQKGSTIDKNLARKNFNDYIRQQEGTIKGKFGEKSTPYTQFFPNGLTAFSEATDMGYRLLVQNVVARATQYVADLGVPFKDAVTALATAYNDAEDTQTTEKGDVSSAKDNLTTERTDLTRQLTINALTIALHFPLDTEKAGIYFNTSLLFAQHRTHIHKGEPAAGATVLVAKITYEAGKEIKMTNQGAAELIFQMFLQGNAVGNSFTLQPGAVLEKKMSDFFSNADELKVTNTDSVIGKYVVKEIA